MPLFCCPLTDLNETNSLLAEYNFNSRQQEKGASLGGLSSRRIGSAEVRRVEAIG